MARGWLPLNLWASLQVLPVKAFPYSPEPPCAMTNINKNVSNMPGTMLHGNWGNSPMKKPNSGVASLGRQPLKFNSCKIKVVRGSSGGDGEMSHRGKGARVQRRTLSRIWLKCTIVELKTPAGQRKVIGIERQAWVRSCWFMGTMLSTQDIVFLYFSILPFSTLESPIPAEAHPDKTVVFMATG